MALTTAKAITIMFDQVLKTMNAENLMATMADTYNVPSATMQNSANVIWRQVEQHAPVKEGFDMTGQFGSVIEQSYPAVLQDPKNDAFELRADDFRDERFMTRRATAAGKKLSSDQNGRIAQLVTDTGSLYYESASADFNYIATADEIYGELQLDDTMGRTFFLNTNSNRRIAADLAARGTLSGRPEGAYARAMVGSDIAGFDVYKAKGFLPTLTASTMAATTMTGNQSFKPEGGILNADDSRVPVDYREATITVASTANAVRGDKIQMTGLFGVSAQNKQRTNTQRTFTIVEVVSGTQLKIFPKPIILEDATLTSDEAAYANCSITGGTAGIPGGTAVTAVNTDTGIVDAHWTNDSIEILSGDMPLEMMGDLDGFKVVSERLDSGTTLYMMYQGSIETLNLRCRLLTWYGLTNRKPDHNGTSRLT